MFPIAGVLIWLALGGLVGWLAGKVTGTSDSQNTMANTGVGLVASVVTGFLVTFAAGGERSVLGFWMAIVIAALSAVVAVSLYHLLSHGRPTQIR